MSFSLQFFFPLCCMQDKGLHAFRDRHILFVNQGDRPHRMLRKRNHADFILRHIGKNKIHGSRVCLALSAQLIAQAESAGIKVGVDGYAFLRGCVEQQVMNQEVVILQDQRFCQCFTNGNFLPVVKAASRMDDEKYLL